MGGDGVYYSDIAGDCGWSLPIKTHVINVTGAGDAMMAGLASCWVDGMPFIDSVRFAQGCSSMALACEYMHGRRIRVTIDGDGLNSQTLAFDGHFFTPCRR